MDTPEQSSLKEMGNSIDSLTYEEALDQLEQVINSLELGEQTLEKSLELYERGQALARRCSHLLNQAEMKIKLLSAENLVDFEPEN